MQIFSGEIRAPEITVSGSVSADVVITSAFTAVAYTGVINASVVSATTLNVSAGNIGTVSAQKIDSNIVSANQVNIVTVLNANVASAAVAVVASSLNLGTFSAQVVRASAVHHKNSHGLVSFASAAQAQTIVTASAYASMSSNSLGGSPEGMKGFTRISTTTLRYDGVVTAKMLAQYNANIFITTVAQTVAMSLFKNGALVPESRSTSTADSVTIANYSGSAIIQMKTNDALTLRIKSSGQSNLTVTTGSLMISCHPVSFEF